LPSGRQAVHAKRTNLKETISRTPSAVSRQELSTVF